MALRMLMAAKCPAARALQPVVVCMGAATSPPVRRRRHTTRAAGAEGGADSSGAVTELPQQRAVMQRLQSNFCRICGSKISIQQHEGKEWRHICERCGYVDFFNPKVVVGAVVQHEGKILLCKRAIEPCRGLWTLPAGFMELGESSAAGAARETLEEANAAIDILAPYAHWDIPVIGQAYILFRARLAAPHTFSAGAESLEVGLFEPDAIPFDQIAFSSVSTTLRLFLDDMAAGTWHFHHGVIDRRPDAAPNDPTAYVLRDHFKLRAEGAGGSAAA